MMAMFGGPQDVTLDAFREMLKTRGIVSGTTDEVIDQLGQLAALGLEEMQFQHFDFDSDDVPAYLASEIAPAVRDL
jgi:hypothetical protein